MESSCNICIPKRYTLKIYKSKIYKYLHALPEKVNNICKFIYYNVLISFKMHRKDLVAVENELLSYSKIGYKG